MRTAVLFPSLARLQVQQVFAAGGEVHLEVRPRTRTACCLSCHRRSGRVHSAYVREVADLPAAGRPVLLHLYVRRFRCLHPQCPRRTFVEQVPTLVAPYGRRTVQLRAALEHVGLAVGGRPGHRLCSRLGLRASRDLLIHLVRALPEPEVHGARVLGVDEFSVRRGPEYATVLVDAESHRPIDVLDERSADQFAAWLQQHTPAEIICRDRAGCYADGATRGAPRAVQVADRYHMLANLADALERVAHQHARCWTTDPLALAPPISPPAAPAPQAETRIARRLRERFEQVHALRDRGLTITVIPRTLHLDRHPVRKFARASGTGSFPRSQPRAPSSRLLARFVAYLQRRWREGGEDGVLLLQELQRQGYRGSLRTLQRYLHTLRGATPVREPRLVVSARSVVSLILRPVAALAPHEARLLEHLCACCSDLASSCRLARACLSIVRERRGGVALRTWLEEAATSKVAALARFAAGLRQDEAAITAGVTLPWNSGVVEGHNTRIKLIKRMMYGRGLFDLLRRRVLLAR